MESHKKSMVPHHQPEEDEWIMTFHEENGMSSSQLTFTPSSFRGVGQPLNQSHKKIGFSGKCPRNQSIDGLCSIKYVGFL